VCTRCLRASTSKSSGRSRATRRSPTCSTRRAADPPNPGNAAERLPDEGNAERLAEFFATDEPTVVYFGKLMPTKGVNLLLDALREVGARAVIVGFGESREELEAQAPPARSSRGARSTATSSTCCRSATWRSSRRSSRRRSAWSPPRLPRPAARPWWRATRPRGDRRRARGVVRPERAHLASFRSGDAADLAAKLRELLALPADERRALGEAARRTVVERWSWTSVARRLLEPF
jgi:glycosyltransferase involved in cell wall biosynthesis